MTAQIKPLPLSVLDAATSGAAKCSVGSHENYRATSYCVNCDVLLCVNCSAGGFCKRCKATVRSLGAIALLNGKP